MGCRKIDPVKYIEKDISRQITVSERQVDTTNKADTLARLCSTKVGVSINPSSDSSPCFDNVARHFRRSSARRVRCSTRQTRILKNQAKLDSLMAELKQEKAYEKVCVL